MVRRGEGTMHLSRACKNIDAFKAREGNASSRDGEDMRKTRR